LGLAKGTEIARTKCAWLVALVAVSATLGVIGQSELFRGEFLVWLLEAYALERVLLVLACRAVRLLLDEGLEGNAPSALTLSNIRA
jgi:hypothetical protein